MSAVLHLASTRVSVLGHSLRTPVMVASGPIVDTRDQIVRAFEAGCGAVVTKTIFAGPPARAKERSVYIPTGALNSTLYSHKSVEQWRETLQELTAVVPGPIIASIHAPSASALASLAESLSDCASAFELGIACPNDGAQQGLSTRTVYELSRAVRSVCEVPFSVKLAIGDSLLDQVRAAIDGGAAAISLSDTIPGIGVDTERHKLKLGGVVGYSGPGIKPLVLHAIYRLRERGIDHPILGIGGVQNVQDVLEYLQVGAHAVQLYTALMKGFAPLRVITAALSSHCSERQLSARALIGAALGEIGPCSQAN